MNFEEALKNARLGKVIRRKIWNGNKVVCLIISKKMQNTKILAFHIKEKEEYIPYKTNYKDYVARDWEIVEE